MTDERDQKKIVTLFSAVEKRVALFEDKIRDSEMKLIAVSFSRIVALLKSNDGNENFS